MPNINNMTTEGQGQMSFKQLYDNLPSRTEIKPPKKAFVDTIASITKRSTQTVRMWLQGVQQPDALAKSVIEEHLGIPADILFPKTAKQ